MISTCIKIYETIVGVAHPAVPGGMECCVWLVAIRLCARAPVSGQAIVVLNLDAGNGGSPVTNYASFANFDVAAGTYVVALELGGRADGYV